MHKIVIYVLIILMIIIRPYFEADQDQVRTLFITVNRLIAPADQESLFEHYIDHSLEEEISRIPEYYAHRQGGFWVAILGEDIVGMFGLEQVNERVFELRRMYVDPEFRRKGIAKNLLRHAELKGREMGAKTIILSTSELQKAALSLYRQSGYHLVKEEVAKEANNKTIGGGIRRYHFTKDL